MTGPAAAAARAAADDVLMPTYRRYPVTFTRGEGLHLFDEAGRRYLDCVAGVAVLALGHAHPEVTDAIARQAGRLVHTSNLYYTEPMAELAARLTGLLGWTDGRVFFANSGAEANECALKLARRWGAGERTGVVAAWGSFHGRTLQTLAATGQPAKWAPFQPLPAGFTHVPFGDAPAAAQAMGAGTDVAVLLEPVQGEGGVNVPEPGYLPAVRAACDEHRVALILDEVQTGLGRTGAWFGFQHADPPGGAVPDVITLGKALGGGLPVGACVARGELATAFQPGDHATTMGGGPVGCAGALAVLNVIERDDLVSRARLVGAYLLEQLDGLAGRHELAAGARGQGLLLALQLTGDRAREVATAALELGLLVNDVGPAVLRLCPPLIIGEADCDEAVALLDKALSVVEGSAA